LQAKAAASAAAAEELAMRIQEAVQQEGAAKYERGFQEGFRKGQYSGGDGIVDQLLPNGFILPEVTVHEILSAGIESLKSRLHPVMNTQEVVSHIVDALDHRKPLAVVRLGDGELLTMAQDAVMSQEQVRAEGEFLSYAGVQVPDLMTRDLLVQAVTEPSTIVGIPLLRMQNFQPLAFSVFRAYGLDYRLLKLTHSTINYAIYLEHALPQILTGRRVLIVGNLAGPLSDVLRGHGVDVVDVVSPVNGASDIDRVMGEIAQRDFDIALVSAGVSAVILCRRIASELGRVALDFGHLADSMAKGDAPYA
jgi:hypothetical protein